MAGADPDLSELESAAREVEQDPLAGETYIESDAEALRSSVAPVEQGDLELALLQLDGSFGPKCRKSKACTVLYLTVPSLRRARLSGLIDDLEADPDVLPLSPTTPQIRTLAESLRRPGERLPLVIAAFQEGAFRSAVAYWVGDKSLVQVETLEQLHKLAEGWSGGLPDPESWQQARALSEREAKALVLDRVNTCRVREERAARRQIEAARLRLTRELGRYLVCAVGRSVDLNATLYGLMSRTSVGAPRLRRCHDTLGGYPEWPPALCKELDSFFNRLSEGQRQSRQMGSELDAALDDPRWRASIASRSLGGGNDESTAASVAKWQNAHGWRAR